MRRKVLFRRQASLDLAHAIEWYESKRKGLGSQFLLAVEAALGSISAEPERFPIGHENIRKSRIKRFPYSVYFTFDAEIVRIIAVFHARRNPRALLGPNE